jgi:hypothetical protein
MTVSREKQQNNLTCWGIVSQPGRQFTHSAYSQVAEKYVLPTKQISQKSMKAVAWE